MQPIRQTWRQWIIICFDQWRIPYLVQNLKDFFDLQNFIDNFIALKPKLSYQDGILKLLGLWRKFIEILGKYFDG